MTEEKASELADKDREIQELQDAIEIKQTENAQQVETENYTLKEQIADL